MGMIRGLIKAGMAKKAIDIARRPENQRKIKDLVANARNKKGSGR